MRRGGGAAVGFGGIGASELVVILLIALLIFGPSRLAEVGSSLGKAVRDFRKAMQEEVHRDS
jgi:sec-independent protein translocase protein TatA